jgi:hypothetical protein
VEACGQQQDSGRVTGAIRDQNGGNRPQLRNSYAKKQIGGGDGVEYVSEIGDKHNKLDDNGTKRFVTFYITNFIEQANYWFLCKGFEVCGFWMISMWLRGVTQEDKRMVLYGF